MNGLDILLAHDRIAWLNREALAIQRRSHVAAPVTKSAVTRDVNGDPRGPHSGATAAAPRIQPAAHP